MGAVAVRPAGVVLQRCCLPLSSLCASASARKPLLPPPPPPVLTWLSSACWRQQLQQQHQGVCSAASPASAAEASKPAAAPQLEAKTVSAGNPKRVVFLGTPDVAAEALWILTDASRIYGSGFEVAAVVTQPPSKRGRGGKELLATPTASMARRLGMEDDAILEPASARDPQFLEALRAIKPDLCITAAYGQFLPQSFLDIPRLGTLNIHPSLLPLYRGASPVQRALQDGVSVTGVSVLYTVLKMDAGPVLAAQSVPVDENITAPELLEILFQRGATLLLSVLPTVLSGKGMEIAQPQDESKATHAAKLDKEEGLLTFGPDSTARALHNKVRAFAGWPGTRAHFAIEKEDGSQELIELKIVATRVADENESEQCRSKGKEVTIMYEELQVVCGDGSVLQVLEVQPPAKKVQSARAFWNGLRGRKLFVADRE
eukprot:jgi/Chlat1/6036/Chrsp4S06329